MTREHGHHFPKINDPGRITEIRDPDKLKTVRLPQFF
jgi:hypothetical protein